MNTIYDNDTIQDLLFINDNAYCWRTYERAKKKFEQIKDKLSESDANRLQKNLDAIGSTDATKYYYSDLNETIRQLVNRGETILPPPKDKSKPKSNPDFDAVSPGRIKQANQKARLEVVQTEAKTKPLYERVVLPNVEKQLIGSIEPLPIRDSVVSILEDIDKQMQTNFKIEYNIRRHMSREAKRVTLPDGGVPYNHIYNYLIIILNNYLTEYEIKRVNMYKNNDVIEISWKN